MPAEFPWAEARRLAERPGKVRRVFVADDRGNLQHRYIGIAQQLGCDLEELATPLIGGKSHGAQRLAFSGMV